MDHVESISYAVGTHSVDGGERGTEREVHIFPHTRWTASPADHGGGGAGAVEGPGGASRSIWPGKKTSGLCITGYCRYSKMEGFVWKREEVGLVFTTAQ